MMKKVFLILLSVLIIFFSSLLIIHVFSEDSITIDTGYEEEDLTFDLLDEIDENLIEENVEVEIGEII